MKEVKRNNRGSALPDLTWLGKVHLYKEEGSNHTSIFFGGSAFFFFEGRRAEEASAKKHSDYGKRRCGSHKSMYPTISYPNRHNWDSSLINAPTEYEEFR